MITFIRLGEKTQHNNNTVAIAPFQTREKTPSNFKMYWCWSFSFRNRVDNNYESTRKKYTKRYALQQFQFFAEGAFQTVLSQLDNLRLANKLS